MDKRVKEIFETMDYEKFKFFKENRKLNPRNYAKLVASMEEEQLLIPIIVNSKFEIIDGQHRFTAARELNKPIFYFINEDYGLKETKIANMVASTWTIEDFLHMLMESGMPEYEEINSIQEKYGIRLTDILKIFAQIQGKNLKIMTKNFQMGTITLEGMEKVIEFLENLNDFDFFPFYRSRNFFCAFMKLYFQKDYDHEKMKERLKVRRGSFEYKGTADDYLLMLTKEVYSFGAIKKPLYYDKETRKFYS